MTFGETLARCLMLQIRCDAVRDTINTALQFVQGSKNVLKVEVNIS
jgi:hypothetical protein